MGKQESVSDWFQMAKDYANAAESEKRLEELVKRKNNGKQEHHASNQGAKGGYHQKQQ